MQENKKICVIDDSDTALLLMHYSLSDAGYVVHTFSNVKDALTFLSQTIPDMVLLDLSMPDVSGFDFLNMRSQLHLENTPILVISAYDSKDSIKTALNLGAVDFISKPVMIDQLLQKIKAHMK
jgi:putative two-component system response regulator